MKEDSHYQFDIENVDQPSPKENDNPKMKPIKTNSVIKNGKWNRDPSVALRAIMETDYKCEVSNHLTFISKTTNNPYVEAHHLIPLHTQDSFDYSLDVPANIVSLCPNCHRFLHHALLSEKIQILNRLYYERENRLKKLQY